MASPKNHVFCCSKNARHLLPKCQICLRKQILFLQANLTFRQQMSCIFAVAKNVIFGEVMIYLRKFYVGINYET